MRTNFVHVALVESGNQLTSNMKTLFVQLTPNQAMLGPQREPRMSTCCSDSPHSTQSWAPLACRLPRPSCFSGRASRRHGCLCFLWGAKAQAKSIQPHCRHMGGPKICESPQLGRFEGTNSGVTRRKPSQTVAILGRGQMRILRNTALQLSKKGIPRGHSIATWLPLAAPMFLGSCFQVLPFCTFHRKWQTHPQTTTLLVYAADSIYLWETKGMSHPLKTKGRTVGRNAWDHDGLNPSGQSLSFGTRRRNMEAQWKTHPFG